MNVISGFVEQLLKRPQEKENMETLQIIKSSTDHLVRIVNDILDFSKLESGKMKLEPVHFNARELFQEMVLLFGSASRDKDVAFHVSVGEDVPGHLYGDPIRLKQIIINLAGNAVKFTEKGTVTLSVAAGNQVAGHLDLKLTVKDTGIGIAADKLDMIFEDFTQAESGTTQKFGGTGLGLSIVRKLAELHGGEIKVFSTPGEGTTFVCRLPYRKGKAEDVEQKPVRGFRIPEPLRQLNILIVDDEVYNRKLVGSILGKWQIPWREAGSGEEAVEMTSGERFDVILMDNRMPGMDGLEASGRIRASVPKGADGPAIVSFTAATVPKEKKKEYRQVGIDRFLSKPFAEKELFELLLDLRGLDHEEHMALEEEPVPAGDAGPAAIDLDQLYRVAGGDEAFVMEMLEKFIQSFDEGYEKMEDAIDRKAFREAGDAAHRLASPTRHIGAEELLALLKAIEHGAEEETVTADLSAMAADVRREYDTVRKQIMAHLDRRKG
jgi:CheY-like chemotaxis protein